MSTGIYLISNNHNAEAKTYFEKAISLQPNQPYAYAYMSQFATGTEAMALLNQSISLGDFGFAFEGRGKLYFLQNKYQKAIEDEGRAIEVDPYDEHALGIRSSAYFMLNQYQQALEDADKATQMNEDYTEGWIYKGNALYSLNRCPEALSAFQKAVDISKGNSPITPIFSKIFNNPKCTTKLKP